MNRSLKLSALIAFALGSSQLLALDMGQIQVKSALWQPLLAEIPISAATPAELRGITVELASSEEFARAGIVGGRPTVPLNFNVVTSGGRSVIRVTSTVAVNDPYLDLLIQVNGHAGKSVREFAVLLDPPNSSSTGPVTASAAPPTVAPAPRPASTTSESHPLPRHVERDAGSTPPTRSVRTASAATSKPRSPSTVSPSADKGQYGPVKSGQTLSSIARSTAASAGVSMDQMLVALKQANPDAFYRDNINALKRGVVLRIPAAADAQAMATAAAIAEVQRQNSDWRAGRVGKSVAVADAATRSSASGASASGTNASTDRLALVSASDKSGSTDQNGRAGGTGDSSSAGIRQELQRTKESLASVQQQDSDLKVRLQDLTDINSKNEHLLSLKDTEIADLQNKLATARKAAGLPAQPAPVVASSAASAKAPATVAVPAPVTAAPITTPAAAASAPVSVGSTAAAAASTAPTASSSAVAPAAAAASTPVVAKPLPVVKPVTTPVADEPWYSQPWAWAAGAGVIVVLALLAVLDRRRKAAAATPPVDSSLADRFSPELTGHDPSDFDQNELLDQLAEHPDDIGLHLELVTLYYSRRDVDHFEAAAEAMHAHITDPDQDEWQDVLNMGEDLAPGHPLFDHHEELPPPDFDETRRAFDLDDYSAEPELHAEPAAKPFDHFSAVEASPPPTMPELPPARTVSEYSLDFDLNTPFRAAPKPYSAEEAKASDVAASAPPELPAESFSAPHAPVHTDEPVAEYNLDGFQASSADRLDEFNDDPVDTKLDLARAYVDMGDADGARAMLGEVLKEGTQIQQDVAKRILETLD